MMCSIKHNCCYVMHCTRDCLKLFFIYSPSELTVLLLLHSGLHIVQLEHCQKTKAARFHLYLLQNSTDQQ